MRVLQRSRTNNCLAVLKELFKTNVSRLSVKIAPDWLVRCSMVNTQDLRPPGWQRPDEGLAEVKDQKLLAVLKELFETNVFKTTPVVFFRFLGPLLVTQDTER